MIGGGQSGSGARLEPSNESVAGILAGCAGAYRRPPPELIASRSSASAFWTSSQAPASWLRRPPLAELDLLVRAAPKEVDTCFARSSCRAKISSRGRSTRRAADLRAGRGACQRDVDAELVPGLAHVPMHQRADLEVLRRSSRAGRRPCLYGRTPLLEITCRPLDAAQLVDQGLRETVRQVAERIRSSRRPARSTAPRCGWDRAPDSSAAPPAPRRG